MGTDNFWGVTRLEHVTDHPPPHSTEVANGLEQYICLPSVPCRLVMGDLHLYIHTHTHTSILDQLMLLYLWLGV